MAAICRDPEVDGVLLNFGPIAESERYQAREMARRSVELARDAGKPLAITVICTLDEEEYFLETLRSPVFHFPGEAVRSLAYSRFFARRAELPRQEPLPLQFEHAAIQAILPEPPVHGFLPLPQALSLIAALGIPVAPWHTATSPQEALTAAQSLGYPVVLKLIAPSLIHKTEGGGVLLDLTDAAAVAAGFATLAAVAQKYLPAGEPWEVLVMSQATGGRELLLGANQDPSFGPVIAFGAGGVDTEVLEDVALRVTPLDEPEAWRQIAETRMGRILAGIRGQPPADLAALSRALLALSQLMLDFPQITEVDLNPVLAFPGQPGILTLDARIRVGQG
jgi:acetyltransferase